MAGFNNTPLTLDFIETQLRIELKQSDALVISEQGIAPLSEEQREHIIVHLQEQRHSSTSTRQAISPMFTTFRTSSDEDFIQAHLQRLFQHSSFNLTDALQENILTYCKTHQPHMIIRLNLFEYNTEANSFLLTLQHRSITLPTDAPFTLTLKHHTPSHPHIKTALALPASIALQNEAKQDGFSDALWINEQGFITETTVANIFFIQDNTLLTPALLMDNKPQCLAGTTRNAIIKNIAPSLCLSVIKDPITPEALPKMSGAFICNAGIGVQRIDAINNHRFPWTEDTTSVFNHTQNKIKALLNLP